MPVTVAAVVYKIVTEPLWHEAVVKGSFTGSPADVRDGFIHFSAAAQVRDTAAKHFAGTAGLVLVAVATAGLDVRWEPSRGGDLFPHLYDALPVTAVRWTRPLPLSPSGDHVFPDLD